MRAMPGEGFAGANVTVPHKGAALAVADELSETAREIGAANTLSFADGEIRADNTDAAGPARRAARPRPAGARALVLGAGGAARAVVWALVREGAEVEVWNRTELRSAQPLRGAGRARRSPTPDQAAYELIVNTTAVGLRGEDPFEELPLARRRLRRRPDRRRHGLRRASRPRCCGAAEAAGATVVDGIEVLVQQGALSLRIWTGREPPLEAMRAAARG